VIEGKVTTDRYGREKSAEVIAAEVGLSPQTVRNILKKAGYKKTKPTRKPGLTQAMKDARLAFCLAHAGKGDEFWHNVIWTDETSVLLGHRRGGYRLWRKSNERVTRSVIRPRWKGYSEFMFWGCFTYKEKGPCYIYPRETVEMRKRALGRVDKLNEIMEPLKKVEWEASEQERRQKLKRKPGKPCTWKWNKENGKLERSKGGGIDWFRYWSEIQTPKLIPFAKRVNGIIVEDGCGSHSHWFIQHVYNIHEVAKIVWCGNSPDLNAIEPVWPRMKRDTIKKGPPQSRAEGVKVWKQAWKDVPQEALQGYVERIREHIQRVIDCEGGNEYEEGLKTRERLRQERIKKREQQKIEKEQKMQEIIDQKQQVNILKKQNQEKKKESLKQERQEDKEKVRVEREFQRKIRERELDRLREERAKQKVERKLQKQQEIEQEIEQQSKRQVERQKLQWQQQVEREIELQKLRGQEQIKQKVEQQTGMQVEQQIRQEMEQEIDQQVEQQVKQQIRQEIEQHADWEVEQQVEQQIELEVKHIKEIVEKPQCRKKGRIMQKPEEAQVGQSRVLRSRERRER